MWNVWTEESKAMNIFACRLTNGSFPQSRKMALSTEMKNKCNLSFPLKSNPTKTTGAYSKILR